MLKFKWYETILDKIQKFFRNNTLSNNPLWRIYVHYNGTAFSVLKDVSKVFKKPIRKWKICNPYEFGGHFNHIPLILQLDNVGCFWKDKFDSPRFEGEPGSVFGPSPRISLTLFRTFRIVVWWEAPTNYMDADTYWEMWLWYKYYCGSDMEKARATWPWTDMEDNSTWKEEFVLPVKA